MSLSRTSPMFFRLPLADWAGAGLLLVAALGFFLGQIPEAPALVNGLPGYWGTLGCTLGMLLAVFAGVTFASPEQNFRQRRAGLAVSTLCVLGLAYQMAWCGSHLVV